MKFERRIVVVFFFFELYLQQDSDEKGEKEKISSPFDNFFLKNTDYF